MKLSFLSGAIVAALALAGCDATLPFDTTTVTTHQVVVAVDAFNLTEQTATVYERLPPCPQAALCRTASVVHAINIPLRAGISARNRLLVAARSSSGTVSVNDFSVLTGAVSTLKATFAANGIN